MPCQDKRDYKDGANGVFSGFEQANRYVILDAHGNHVGYMAEQEQGIGKMMARQWFNTHRSFITHVFDKHQNEVLRVRLISSARHGQGVLTVAVSPTVFLDQFAHSSI